MFLVKKEHSLYTNVFVRKNSLNKNIFVENTPFNKIYLFRETLISIEILDTTQNTA